MQLTEITDDFILSNPYKEFEYTIPAFESVKINYMWSFFQVLELSDPTGVKIRFGGSASFTDVVSAGVGFALPKNKMTDRVDIENTTGASVTIKIALAIGTINDQRFTTSGTIVTKDVGTTLSAPSKTTVGTSAVMLAGANSNRKEIAIFNGSPSIELWIGGSDVDANKNFAMLQLQQVVLSTTAEVWALRPSSSGADVKILEIEY